jgi:molybdenum-dependent DNA-binding transcriptional regulator ModE
MTPTVHGERLAGDKVRIGVGEKKTAPTRSATSSSRSRARISLAFWRISDENVCRTGGVTVSPGATTLAVIPSTSIILSSHILGVILLRCCLRFGVNFCNKETSHGSSTMDLRHLRSFIAVAEELSFRRAAERLHMSLPPLSRQIRTLEDELGVQLLERERRIPVCLTDAGRAFLVEANQTIVSAEKALRSARQAQQGSHADRLVPRVGSQG